MKYKVENGILYEGKSDRQSAGLCPFCDKDVFVSDGQIITTFKGLPTHKSCRKYADKTYL